MEGSPPDPLLRLNLLAHDGGECDMDHSCANCLTDNGTSYRAAVGANINMILTHPRGRRFRVSRMVIRGPDPSPAPVRDGMVFVTSSRLVPRCWGRVPGGVILLRASIAVALRAKATGVQHQQTRATRTDAEGSAAVAAMSVARRCAGRASRTLAASTTSPASASTRSACASPTPPPPTRRRTRATACSPPRYSSPCRAATPRPPATPPARPPPPRAAPP